MKQVNLFGTDFKDTGAKKYTTSNEAPIYEPSHKKPHLAELCNTYKSNRLIREIENSSVTDEEKQFLIESAKRHSVFHYENIADYYAHSNKEMQNLMEKSALVIIDFNKAIELGYVRLCDEIRSQYLEEYGE